MGKMLFKVLNKDGTPRNGGTGKWILPRGKKPGEWMPKVKNIEPCSRGYHLCEFEDLLEWLGPVIWIAEGRGKSIRDTHKTVFPEARLLKKVSTWNNKTARLFAADCAEHVLHLNPDPRCEKAIAMARRFAQGKATQTQLAAAWAAARDVIKDAGGDVVRDAVKDVAWAAARYAAGATVRATAIAMAWDVAWAAEQKWQTRKLWEYLKVGDKP